MPKFTKPSSWASPMVRARALGVNASNAPARAVQRSASLRVRIRFIFMLHPLKQMPCQRKIHTESIDVNTLLIYIYDYTLVLIVTAAKAEFRKGSRRLTGQRSTNYN